MSDVTGMRRAAARAAADLVKNGMTLGLGSGATFLLVLERLAERMRDERLELRGVPSSRKTAEAAAAAGIVVVDLDDCEVLDLAIDGADEVGPGKHLIKGGGGALVRERIVAAAAKELIVVVDERKLVDALGRAFPLPVEVLPFGWRHTTRRIETTGCKGVRREVDGAPFVTDNGNYVIDCKYDGIDDPAWVSELLLQLPGVVDHGLFIGMAGRVFIGETGDKVRVLP